MQVTVENTTGQAIHVEAIRAIDASGDDIVNLDGPAAQDRVLSDSFSEDRPAMQIHDLADAPYKQPTLMHRGVGSQMIYNRESHESFFVAALTSDKFLTVLRLHLAAGGSPRIASYEVESTGTTELELENSLQDSPAEDQIPLSLALANGGHLDSERVLLSVSKDYHHQLETYGSLIRQIHHPRSAPPLMGWWSWTAFYFGLNEGAAITNAQWESEHLLPLGYDVFHIDEGYQYARGEYTTPNATLFPARPHAAGVQSPRPGPRSRHLDRAVRSFRARLGLRASSRLADPQREGPADPGRRRDRSAKTRSTCST